MTHGAYMYLMGIIVGLVARSLLVGGIKDVARALARWPAPPLPPVKWATPPALDGHTLPSPNDSRWELSSMGTLAVFRGVLPLSQTWTPKKAPRLFRRIEISFPTQPMPHPRHNHAPRRNHERHSAVDVRLRCPPDRRR